MNLCEETSITGKPSATEVQVSHEQRYETQGPPGSVLVWRLPVFLRRWADQAVLDGRSFPVSELRGTGAGDGIDSRGKLTLMSKGLGKVGLAVLAALPPDGGWECRSSVSWAVAWQLGRGVWSFSESAKSLAAAVAAGEYDDNPELLEFRTLSLRLSFGNRPYLRPSLVASVSRAVRILESKRLIEVSEAGSEKSYPLDERPVFALPRHHRYWARSRRSGLLRLKISVEVNTYEAGK